MRSIRRSVGRASVLVVATVGSLAGAGVAPAGAATRVTTTHLTATGQAVAGRIPQWPGGYGPYAGMSGGLRRALAAPSSRLPGFDVSPRGAGTATAWSIQASPNVVVRNGALAAEDCYSKSACMAVGSFLNTSGAYEALIERWNGTSWSEEPTPPVLGPSVLSGVACPAANSCVAVGSSLTLFGEAALVEVWNGSSWATQTFPDPGGSPLSALSGVSCSTPNNCTAVGMYGGTSPTSALSLTLAGHWNGRSWQIQSTPNPVNSIFTSLSSVSCPSATVCTAVGSSQFGTLAERWDGRRWKMQVTPNPASSYFSAVSCTRDAACMAVGAYTDSLGKQLTLAETWNGSFWHTRKSPNPRGSTANAFDGVSCAAGKCTAVGYSSKGILAEGWDGFAWRLESPVQPSGTTSAALLAVSCPAAGVCNATGSYLAPTLAQVSLAEHWNGRAWSRQATVNPKGTLSSALYAVACPSATTCLGVGNYATGTGTAALSEKRQGASWAVVSTPDPAGASQTTLTSISCGAPTACVAVGFYVNATGGGTLAESWDGSRWTIQATQNAPGTQQDTLTAVSCSGANACTAVGFDYDSNGVPAALAEVWNGATWTLQSIAGPGGGAQLPYLAAVSCASTDACVTVGNDISATGVQTAFTEAWDGHTWTVHPAPVPAGTLASALFGVSCTTANACVSVGGHVDPSRVGQTLTESWNGTVWKLQASPNPGGSVFSTLTAVSCPSGTDCEAVGYATTNTMASVWDGTSWKLQSTANPATAQQSDLAGVSCPTSVCTAVGYYLQGQSTATLVETNG